jgi:glycolate dehydrogenase iron-sulfur subunit
LPVDSNERAECMIKEIERLSSTEYRAKLNQCVHCGLCLQACPTYVALGTETDNPRGRISLMRAASAGRLSVNEFNGAFADHIRLCLECRACETACPSGVKYGLLVGGARMAVEANRRVGTGERFVRWIGMRQMMPNLQRLKLAARGLWVYQATGAQRLVRRLDFLPKPLKAMDAIVPTIVPRYYDYRQPAEPLGERRGQVAFFIGCIQEALLSQVNSATVHVLQVNGYEVHFPAGQTCCGAAQLHVGDEKLTRELARRNIDAFLEGDFEAIICNAGGCGATLKDEYVGLFEDDPVYAERATQFSSKVRDVTEFLADHLNVPPTGEVRVRATYSDSCHLRHAQKVSKQPRTLLRQIPGLELVELKLPDRCCGSAGVYNITQVDTANQVLDAKMADIAATKADVIVVSNTGCQMQLDAGARRAGLKAEVLHVVEVLDRSYRNGKPQQGETS